MKRCAYCGSKGPLTREHIWPKWLLERNDFGIRYIERAGGIVGGDFIVRDVCSECNNGPLSALDTYALALYESYFGRPVNSDQSVLFKYDFGKLLRWLLKIAFNTSRTTGKDAELLSAYAPIIRSPHDCSPINAVAFVGTVMPAKIIDKLSGRRKIVKPQGVRSGPLGVPGMEFSGWCALRAITVNAYCFSLLVTRSTTIDLERTVALVEQLYGIPILPNGEIKIPPPKMTTMGLMKGIETWRKPKRLE